MHIYTSIWLLLYKASTLYYYFIWDISFTSAWQAWCQEWCCIWGHFIPSLISWQLLEAILGVQDCEMCWWNHILSNWFLLMQHLRIIIITGVSEHIHWLQRALLDIVGLHFYSGIGNKILLLIETPWVVSLIRWERIHAVKQCCHCWWHLRCSNLRKTTSANLAHHFGDIHTLNGHTLNHTLMVNQGGRLELTHSMFL